MKIFMITDSLIRGGKERRLLELLRYLDKYEEIKIVLVILKDIIEYQQVYDLKNTKLIILKRKIKKDPSVYFKLWKLCKSFKPDVMHSWGSMPSVYMSTICFLQKIYFINGMVVNAKSPLFSKDWIRSKITFPFSDIILSNSVAGLKAYHADSKKGRVVHNGFNFDRITHLELEERIRKRLNITTEFIIGMVGAFHPRKDFETFLKAADSICSKRRDICFLAIGDGVLLKELKLKYMGNENIIFTGNVKNVESIMALFTIGVLLSNPSKHQEGISNSILEMMALGKPVIASYGGGTNEIVQDKHTGFLIEAGNAEELINKIVFLLERPQVRSEMGQRAIEVVKDSYSIEQMCEQILQIYTNN